jgi:hypothetical protein
MLSINLMKVEHKDVVCHLFPYTFEGREYTWYLSLTIGSITNWDNFETQFIKNSVMTNPQPV